MAVSRSVAALVGAVGVSLALSSAALAEDKLEWSASLTGTSDYVFRGISQTDNDPTIQGSIGISYGMFYAGGWASGLDFGGTAAPGDGLDAQIEVDWTAGIKPTWGPLSFDFGVIWYTYPGATDFAVEQDYLEFKAGVSGELAPKLSAGATVYYSDDYYYETGESFVYEGTLAYSLPKMWVFDPTLSGLIGYLDYQDTGAPKDLTYWNAGVALAVDNLTFDLRYWDTDYSKADCGGLDLCEERFVFSATVALP